MHKIAFRASKWKYDNNEMYLIGSARGKKTGGVINREIKKENKVKRMKQQ